MRKYKAALIGYYGFDNLGDELLLKASLDMLERFGIKPGEIIILSNNPSETEKIFNIRAINRWSFSQLIKTLLNCERLIFGGGGIFQDSTSVKSCVWYWAVIKLAKFLGVKIFALGQSIGPLNTFTGKLLAANALKDLKILHVRDTPSLIYADKFKLNNIIQGSDLALSLNLNNLNLDLKEEAQDYILLNLRPHKELDKFIKQAQDILKNFNNLTSCADSLNLNFKIIGVALSPEDFDLLSGLKAINIFKLYKFYDSGDITISKLAGLWQGAKFAVGMRLHFNIISFMFNIKFHALCYDPKVEAFNNFAAKFNNNSQALISKAQSELDLLCAEIFNK